MIYKVLITEILSKVIQIDALSEDDAIEQVEKKYLNEEIVLDCNDFQEAKYTVMDSEESN